jgi:hypothetical protein
MSTIYNASITIATIFQGISLEGGGLISALPSKLLVCTGNTNILNIEGMYDQEEQQYWATNASLTGTLLDQFGNLITTINLFYATGSNGNFTGSFGGGTYSPAVGRGYTLLLQGESDWGNFFALPILAEVVTTPEIPGLSGGG